MTDESVAGDSQTYRGWLLLFGPMMILMYALIPIAIASSFWYGAFLLGMFGTVLLFACRALLVYDGTTDGSRSWWLSNAQWAAATLSVVIALGIVRAPFVGSAAFLHLTPTILLGLVGFLIILRREGWSRRGEAERPGESDGEEQS